MEVQTLCVHGDNPSAVDHVRTIRQTLETEGLRIVPMGAYQAADGAHPQASSLVPWRVHSFEDPRLMGVLNELNEQN